MNNLHKAAYLKTVATQQISEVQLVLSSEPFVNHFQIVAKLGFFFPPLFFGMSGGISH